MHIIATRGGEWVVKVTWGGHKLSSMMGTTMCDCELIAPLEGMGACSLMKI